MAGKPGESGDICGRNLKMSTTMEIMTIESNAYRLLVEKIEKITAYVAWNPGRSRSRASSRRIWEGFCACCRKRSWASL